MSIEFKLLTLNGICVKKWNQLLLRCQGLLTAGIGTSTNFIQ